MGNEGLRVCVGIPSIVRDNLGVGPMLVDTLRGLGHRPTLVEDGDSRALQADLLLLVGGSNAWTHYPEMLSRAAKRPRTIVWHLEPLPPPDLPVQAEQAGLSLARCDLNTLSEPWRGIAKHLPFHNAARDVIRWVSASSLRKRLPATTARAVSRVRPYELHHVMREYAWFRQYYATTWSDRVFTSTQARSLFLASRGISAQSVPMGYHRGWGRDLGLDRDIDVLFIGRVDKTSRLSSLRPIQRELASRRVNLVTVERGCFGEQRTRLLNRGRIVLDVVRLPWEMPVMRLLMSMGCGAMVVSDWTGDPAPFAPGHLVQAETGELAAKILHYLEHGEDRLRIARSAYRFVTEELTLARSILEILESAGRV